MKHQTTRRLLASVFVLAVSLPPAANLAGADGADPASEHREMAAFPDFDRRVSSLASYAAGVDAWFSDHFALRSRLVRWNATIRLFALGASSSRAVFVGRDGWLFYADDGAVEDMGHVEPLSESALAAWHETISRAGRWLDARGIAFVFTIAPDKHAVYPERLPAGIRRVGEASRADQLLAALADTGLAVDLGPVLAAAKAPERIYHVTDTHWNERGAHAAYQAIVDAARGRRPQVPPPWGRTDFDEASATTSAGDLAGMLGLTQVLGEERLLLAPRRPRMARVVEPEGADPTAEIGRLVTEIPGSTLPRAVIFRDSFLSPVVPFLSEHFSRAVYVWQNDFDASAVLAEHPDVVIQEIVGRHLYTFTPSPELVPN